MAKRFSDTDKWKKNWFRRLSPLHKVFWEYLRDNCNHAGIWEVDFELAQFQIGAELKPDKIYNDFQKQILIVPGNKKWFIVDFIEYQYGCTIDNLNPNNKVHNSILLLLNKYKIKGLTSPIHTVLDKEQDKDKDKERKKSPKKKPIKSDGGTPYDQIVPFFQDDEFLAAWYEHTKVRKTKKGSPSQRADRHILNQIKTIAGEDKELAIMILGQSSRKGWIDVFPLKINTELPKKKPTGKIIAALYHCYTCEENHDNRQSDNKKPARECPKCNLPMEFEGFSRKKEA